MKQLCRVSILVLTVLALFFSTATSGDIDLLKALEEIKESIEHGVSYEKLVPLLDSVQPQIDALQRGSVRKDCFRDATKRSYYWYDLGVKSWGALMDNEKQRDRYARKAEYGDDEMKEISLKMVENYEKLIKHAQEALPSKWEYGNAEIERARECLDLK